MQSNTIFQGFGVLQGRIGSVVTTVSSSSPTQRASCLLSSSWTPTIGEELVLRRQPENEHSKHTVA